MKKIFLNWKQNGSFSKLLNFKNIINSSKNEVVLFAPLPYLTFAKSMKFELGSQNISPFKNGAFTGEIGAEMLTEIGVKYCLVGHSERRNFFKETQEMLSSKIKRCKEVGIKPVLCIGESLNERKTNKFLSRIANQMEIFEQNVIVAYEPVWSIGTGFTPTTIEIMEIANFLNARYGIKMIYGGSVSEKNATSILDIDNVDGILIGGMSLDANKVNYILNDNSWN